jgi:hypothetical protein
VTAFDAAVWRERSWARAVDRAQGSQPDNVKWAEDVLGISSLQLLVDWCTSRGVAVDFTRRTNGLYDAVTKTISINSRAEPMKQAIYLSHEIGHHLVGSNNARFEKGYASAADPGVNRKFEHKLACLEEEVEAWNRARRLLDRLEAPIPIAKFEAVRIECLKSYVKWAARKGA